MWQKESRIYAGSGVSQTPNTYSVSEGSDNSLVLTVTCSKCNETLTYTITAPDSLTYDGNSHDVTVTIGESDDLYDDTCAGSTGLPLSPSVSYMYSAAESGTKQEISDTSAVGYYTASITLGGVTASVSYQVSTASISEYEYSEVTKYYTGSEITLSDSEFVIYPSGGSAEDDALALGTDFTVDTGSYENNTEVSTDDIKASVTVTGTGNYKDSLTIKYTIAYYSTDDAAIVYKSDGETVLETEEVAYGSVIISAPDGYTICTAIDGTYVDSFTCDTPGSTTVSYYLKQDETGYITGEKTVDIYISAFVITGGTEGTDYTVSTDGTLTILTDTELTISTTQQTSEHIVVASGVEANIILAGVNIVTSGNTKWSACPLYLGDAGVSTVTLASGTENILDASATTDFGPGLMVPNGYQLTITGEGSLTAKGGNSWPGIGRQGGGNILISGGFITAVSGSNAAGIGGSWSYGGGTITITGGYITASGDSSVFGGGRNQSNNATVTITGGYFGAGDTDAGTVYSVSVATGYHVIENTDDTTKDTWGYVVNCTYTVTLDINGGMLVDGKNVTSYTYGTGAALPGEDDISKDSYSFAGWYEEDDFSGSEVAEISETDYGDKTYYAKWAKESQTVIFDSQGGSEVDSITVTYGSAYGELATPEYEGYTFAGWYTAAEDGDLVEGETIVTALDDHTLYAHWNCAHPGYSADGFCTACGNYQPADYNASGYYEISNPGQLCWFAALVNGDDTNADFTNEDIARGASANAVLTANIDMSGYGSCFTPIGLVEGLYNTISSTGSITDWGYTGTFNGQGYVISNLTVTTQSGKAVGVFGTLSGTVINLGVSGFYYYQGSNDARGGAVVGQILPGGTVQNCYVVDSTVICYGSVAGGIAGANYGGIIANCYVYDFYVYATRYGYLVGDNRNDNSVSVFNGTITNCYTESSYNVGQTGTSDTDDVTYKDSSAFASGEVAYLLNGSTSEGALVWYQNLDNGYTVDEYPVLNSSHGTVYYGYAAACSISGSYSNSPLPYTQTGAGHDFDEEGFCSNCGVYEPAVWNGDNEYYEISNAGQLFWFAALVNVDSSNAEFTEDDLDSWCYADAVLMNDIDLNPGYTFNSDGSYTGGDSPRTWTPIGTDKYISGYGWTDYSGSFDGKGYTISGVYIDNSTYYYQGLFGGYVGYNASAEISNVSVTNSYIHNEGGIAGGIAGHACNGSAIENCTFTGTVISEYDSAYAGGIVAYTYDATISNCVNNGTVSAAGTDAYAGGIAGYTDDGNISSCKNNGTVSAAGTYACAGGIAGYTYDSDISSCVNGGTASAIGMYGYAGGIVALAYYGEISGNENTGAVSVDAEYYAYVGGIASYIYGVELSGNKNSGTVYGETDSA